MTIDDIADEAIALRFNANLRTQVRNWARQRYAQVWNAADWPWKHTPPMEFDLTLNDHVQDLSALTDEDQLGDDLTAFRPLSVTNDQGIDLDPVRPFQFNRLFPVRSSPPSNQLGTPDIWSWEIYFDTAGADIRRLLLGPAPTSAATYTIIFERDYVEPDNDTELRLPPGDHYGLVAGVIASGKKRRGDPSWGPDEKDFDNWLDGLKDKWVKPVGSFYFPRDTL